MDIKFKDFVMAIPLIIIACVGVYGLYDSIRVAGWWVMVIPVGGGIFGWAVYAITYFEKRTTNTKDAER